MILTHILIFITCQISSFRLHRLNINPFLKNSAKSDDLSFTVHPSTRQRINTSGHIACVAGILTQLERKSFIYGDCINKMDPST